MAAVSERKILGPNEIDEIKSKLRKLSNSSPEKPPSGPIKIETGFDILFLIFIIGIPSFSLQSSIISFLFQLLNNVFSFRTGFIFGIVNLLVCSDASIA